MDQTRAEGQVEEGLMRLMEDQKIVQQQEGVEDRQKILAQEEQM